jgi:UDP:flavonoid glycosyltransferase YjiC (YdhE family)
MVAFGRGLRAVGDDVTVAAAPGFTGMITAAGLTADPFPDQSAVMQTPHGRRWRDGSVRGGREQLKLWRAVLTDLAPGIADHVAALTGRHDTFVTGMITYAPVLALARARGIRHVTVCLTPSWPTRSGAATMLAPRPDTASPLNLAAGYGSQLGSFLMARPLVAAVGARLDLPRQSLPRYLGDARRTPVLLAVSPQVVPPPPDVPELVLTTGYWTDAPDPDYAPPADVADFLDSGSPPVYVGFGSMPSERPEPLFELVATALRRAGRRGLLLGGWRDWRPDPQPADLLVVEGLPYEWLFPRIAAAVHHGGAGTTATAVRAGVPQLVVPHFGDQPYWGRRVAQLGIGPAPVPRSDLDAERLGDAITRLTGDPGLRSRAESLGARVRAEDGVAVAVAATHRLLGA